MQFEGPAEDRLALHELCASYGDAIYRHDINDLRTLWVEDARWMHPDIGTYEGLDAIVKAIAAAMTRYPQLVFTSMPGSLRVEGDWATGRDYTSELVTDSEGNTYRMTGLYEDEYVKRNGRWFFRSRRFNILHAGEVKTMTGGKP